MITTENFKEVLKSLGFLVENNIYHKMLLEQHCVLKVDFNSEKFIYPKNTTQNPNPKATDSALRPNGIIINDSTTCNFAKPENFVVFECVHRLLEKGYKPYHIELEPKWQLGREAKGGKADILVRDFEGDSYLIIECKTTDSKNSEFKKEWSRMQQNGGQLFSYYRQDKNTKFLCLYTSDFYTDSPQNSKVIYENYILNMQDNEAYLTKHDFKESYKNANNDEEIFKVWNEIYKQDFSQIGIFERNINAYEIGKNALCFEDLKELQSNRDDTDKKHEDGKYHEFAKILRKYNISGKENAFDKLVNLFLCKIYDETYNKNNLHFIYKGVIADSFEGMQDRLMLLYKNAMREFLKEEITFIADEDIEKSFNHYRNNEFSDKSLEKEMKYFIKQLKFYSNNDFAFLEVHNEELFYQNAEVLKSVVKLFENLKLTQNQTNQLLGNLFELFLQKGMKQDEGQFFTPVQICEFIIYSLPLKNLYSNKIPKVLDYACGAGHFLNTYANFLRNFIPQEKLHEYYQNVYGIEKEYRLSKVAKVSSCMYGQNEVTILYADTLSSNTLQNKSFDILITNPPYSVQGFLETLDKKSREAYRLFNKNINPASNNAIECFFIERANQLLNDEAKVAMILPSSILNKGGIYEQARKILLENFELIALVELGSQTFGATGTNTIILFATKRQTYMAKRESSKKYFDLQDRLKGDFLQDNPTLKDNGYLSSYCTFQNYQEQDFLAFLQGELPQNLKAHSHFKEYIIAFKQSNEFKKLKESKDYKASTNRDELENVALIDFAQAIEMEKLLYFALALKNDVLIIKASQDNKEQKKFLGYEWSNRKGDEGIKELNSPYNSPLFERENPYNPNKINFLIQKAFMGETLNIPQDLSTYATSARLIDMIDFGRVEFNKAISLNPSVILSGNEKSQNLTSPFANCKYELVRLGEIVMEIQTAKRPDGGVGNYDSGALSLGGEHIDNTNGYIKLDSPKYVPMEFYEKFKAQNKGIVKENDILICKDGALTGKIAFVRDEFKNQFVMINEHIFLLRCDNIVKQKYLFFILHSNSGQELLKSKITGSAQGGLNQSNLKNLQIPLPPLEIQQQIVAECEKVEEQYNTIRMSIEEYQNLIKAVLVKCGICEATKLEITGGGAIIQTFSSLDSIDVYIQEILTRLMELELQIDWELLSLCYFQSKAEKSQNMESHYSIVDSKRTDIMDCHDSANAESRNDGVAYFASHTSSLRVSGTNAAIHNVESPNAQSFSNDLSELQSLLESLPTLPKEGWEMKNIGEILSLEYGKALQESKRVEGTYPVMGSNGIVGYHNEFIAKSPCIIVGRKGSAGKITYIEKDCFPIDTTFYIETKIQYNKKLLYYVLKSLKLENEKIGIGVPGINRNDLYSLQIPLLPLESQNKIVSTIEVIESKIAYLDSKLPCLGSHKQAIIQKALLEQTKVP